MVKKAIEVKGIRKIVGAFIKEYDPEWYDVGYSFQWMLKDNNLEKMWVYMENDRVIDFMSIHYLDDQIVVSPYFLDDSKVTNELLSITAIWKSFILETEWLDLEKIDYDLHQCSFVSSINNTKEYHIGGNQCYYTNDASLVNFFVDYFERIYFPKLDNVDEISFKIVQPDELFSYIVKDDLNNYCYPSWSEKYGNKHVIGFYYFVPENFADTQYLLALYRDIVVGVIKIGKFGEGKHRRQSICYIDVNEAYRNRGIASKMIKELGKYLDKELPLMVTDESELGKLCHITQHFKDAGYDVPVLSFQEFYAY